MARKEILLTGAGGQGILFLGGILALSSIQQGKRVVSTTSYGAAMRGDAVKCGIVISDGEIHDPQVDSPDMLIALNMASLQKFGSKIKEGGTLICADEEGTLSTVAAIGRQIQVIAVPFETLSQQFGSSKYINMIALGVLLPESGNWPGELIRGVLNKNLKKGGKENLIQENLAAIKAGMDWYHSRKVV